MLLNQILQQLMLLKVLTFIHIKKNVKFFGFTLFRIKNHLPREKIETCLK